MAEKNANSAGEPPAPAAVPEAAAASSWLFVQGAFNRLFYGSLTATLGDRMYQAAVIAAVQFAFVEASSHLAFITLAGVVPQFFLYPIIGSFVDNADRRRLLWGICALKIVLVLAFIPFVMDIYSPSFSSMWKVNLVIIFVLSLITVPFGPTRAASIPDVVSGVDLGLAASLIATTGLVSILGGTTLGSQLAAKMGGWFGFPPELERGPMLVIPVASFLYLAATLLFMGLPDKVAIPGTRRKDVALPEPATPAAGDRKGLAKAASETWEGLVYSFRQRGVLPLILFESLFWICGVAFYVLLEWHAYSVLYIHKADKVVYFGQALGCAGLGLFSGAILIGKLCRKISPILTYPVAVFLMGAGMSATFSAHGQPNEQLDPVIAAANMATSHKIFPWLFMLGLGGGLLLGRIDADLLSVVDERLRGRVFSVKGFFFTGALLTPLLVLGFFPGQEMRQGIAYFLPPVLMLLALPVALFSWVLDCGIYAERRPIVEPGTVERFLFRFSRFISWLISKIYFRYSVIGAEKIPKQGPVILAANHGSFLDPIWLGVGLVRPVQYMVHNKYYRGIGHPFFRFMSCIPVDEGSQIAAIKSSTQALSKGIVVGIFPEGHVSDDGQLQRPEGGAAFLAKRTGAPIVPCAIVGNTRAYPRWFTFPRPNKITIVIGEPFVVPKDASREQLAAYTDQIMASLAKTLELPPPPSGK